MTVLFILQMKQYTASEVELDLENEGLVLFY